MASKINPLKHLKLCFVVIALAFGSFALAYIPDYHMILSRLAETHGRGTYEIEQEVVFPRDPEPLRVKETWIIKGENEMAVTLTGLGPLKGMIEGRIVYGANDKYFQSGGQTNKARLGEDWWQPFFHFRFSKNIKPTLINLKIAPASSLQERRMQKVDQKTVYSEQPFVRLGRTGGVVNYVIGTPAPEGSANPPPGLWIQQDLFVIRKIRLPSQAVVTADDYVQYARQQWLPKKTSVEWDQNHAQIVISRVDALSNDDKRNQIVNQKAPSIELKLPDYAPIREFYQRYR